MKVVFIGPSPYLLTSSAKTLSWLIKDFYLKGNQVAVLAHTHDISFFVPDEKEQGRAYTYKFDENTIPLLPFRKGGEPPNKTEATIIYEALNLLKPDLVISVDDFESCVYMQAVKMFMPDAFKWLFIPLNGSLPINEESKSILEYADAILCTNQFTYKHLKSLYDHPLMDWHYTGAEISKFNYKLREQFSFCCMAKNSFKDGLWVVLEAIKNISKAINTKLYLNTNYGDSGFYNLDILLQRNDPKRDLVILPDKYVSIKDGLSNKELNDFYHTSPFFISSSLLSSASIGLFEALATGCIPIVSNQGCDAEICRLMREKGVNKTYYFKFNTVPLLSSNEKYLKIPIVESLVDNMLDANYIWKNKTIYLETVDQILKFSKGFDHTNFVNKVGEIAQEVVRKDTKVFGLN